MNKYLVFLVFLGSVRATAQTQPPEALQPGISSRMPAARAAADRQVERSQSLAGNPSAPQLVESSDILSLDQLKNRFKIVAEQLKPDFMKNMKTPGELTQLLALGCEAVSTIPTGIEYKPGYLDGTTTLFKCANGDYGRLEVKQGYAGQGQVKELSARAMNDRIGEIPAVGRYKKSSSGITQSILRWEDLNGQSITLDVISNLQNTSTRNSGDGAVQDARIKALAKKISNLR